MPPNCHRSRQVRYCQRAASSAAMLLPLQTLRCRQAATPTTVAYILMLLSLLFPLPLPLPLSVDCVM
jgi:hypothetical protein